MSVAKTPLEGATAHALDAAMIWRDAPTDARLEGPRARAGNNSQSFSFVERLSVE